MSFEFDPQDIGSGPMEIDNIDRQDDAAQKLNQGAVVKIDYDLCDESGVCSEVCPESVIEFKSGHPAVTKPEGCTECWICVENCVSGAIDIG